MAKEIWAPAFVFGERYEVSSRGRVRNRENGHIMHPARNKEGYYLLTLSKNGNERRISLHRLVATAFLPNPDNLPQVNHIDCNKGNNRVSNLEWCTPSQNMQHASRMGRLVNVGRKGDPSLKKPQYTTTDCLNLLKSGEQTKFLKALPLGVTCWEVEKHKDALNLRVIADRLTDRAYSIKFLYNSNTHIVIEVHRKRTLITEKN